MSNGSVPRDRGIINVYDAFKGFGFIRRTKGKDVFFLFDELPSADYEPSQGDIVTFEVKIKTRGPAAINIQKVGHEDASS